MAPSGGVKQPAAGVHNPQSMGGGLYGSGGSMGILEAQAARFQAPGEFLSAQNNFAPIIWVPFVIFIAAKLSAERSYIAVLLVFIAAKL